MVTIFSNIFDKKPNYISVDSALNRIKIGKSKDKVEEIRKQLIYQVFVLVESLKKE